MSLGTLTLPGKMAAIPKAEEALTLFSTLVGKAVQLPCPQELKIKVLEFLMKLSD